jgi:hypothetical protein
MSETRSPFIPGEGWHCKVGLPYRETNKDEAIVFETVANNKMEEEGPGKQKNKIGVRMERTRWSILRHGDFATPALVKYWVVRR